MNRAIPIAIGLLFALPVLTGCGDQSPQPTQVSHVWEFQTQRDPKVATAAAPAPAPAASDDPLDAGVSKGKMSDPLDAGGDALDRGAPAGQDPLSGGGTKNWYWLRGSIQNGAVAITVDGSSIGHYTVHMDREITRKLHPGTNTLTFTPEPDNPDVPVQAHLEVVYSQMQQGDLPPLIYDTKQIDNASAPNMALKMPTLKSAHSNKDAAPALTLPKTGPLTPSPSNPATTMTFVAR